MKDERNPRHATALGKAEELRAQLNGLKQRMPPTLTVVVPCYNEEDVLPETASQLMTVLQELVKEGVITEGSCFYFIDDGSTDTTWTLIEELASLDRRCHGLKLSRNHGHQNALLAGLLNVPGDVVISLDADLQDDPSAIGNMVKEYCRGAEIVYGVRSERKTDTVFKRSSAHLYYMLLKMMGISVVFDHADYRLMSRRAIENLREYKESNIFLRGLIPQLGFRTATVHYIRKERFAGESKYPLRKMIGLAIEGVMSFSAFPLKLITFLGIAISFVTVGMAIWALWVRGVNPDAVPGWASTVIPIYLLGGLQLFCTGVIGQYLAKVYLETKARPRYIVEKIV